MGLSCEGARIFPTPTSWAATRRLGGCASTSASWRLGVYLDGLRDIILQIRKGAFMSKVRVLVGTRKGAFILSSDGKRQKWDVAGPLFAGWEMYHLKGSPADANRLYASQSSGWFGQVIQRSDDGGKTWQAPGGGVTT